MQIVEQQFAYSEREVEGLLQLCKEMAYATEEEKMMLMCLPLDPLAWRAVGKVEGWNGRDYFSNVYRNKQIQFIKDLQEGLSIKEALNNI